MSFRLQADVLEELAKFSPICLEQLNHRAELLERRDSKYVLSSAQLIAFLQYTRDSFDALSIDGLRQFGYRTAYFDSPEAHCFQDHNKGRRLRAKVRTRQYLDSAVQFFEVKLKGRRGATHKFRTPVSEQEFEAQTLAPRLQTFFDEAMRRHYGRSWEHDLVRGLVMDYSRITLVSRQADERITIDHSLAFEGGDAPRAMSTDQWVVEVKSRNGVSPVDRWLFRNKLRPVPGFSKYCIGVSLTRFPDRVSRFTPVIKRTYQPHVENA